MTELDFDELDKAVNSLMSDKGTVESPAPDTPTATVSAPVVVPAPSPASVTPPLAVRRQGQFMDIVRPSSSTTRPVTAPVVRQAVDITPPALTSDVTPQDSVKPLDTASGAVPYGADAEATSVDAQAQASGWPDPIDMTTSAIISDASEVDVQPVVDAISAAPVITPDLPMEEPQTSPFLPDAKVEKRPLGSPISLVEPEPQSTDSELPIEASASLEPNLIDSEQPVETPQDQGGVPEVAPMPEELSDDIVSVEANEAVHDDAMEAPVSEVSAVPEVAPEPAQPNGGGAISPQYQEQPSTGDQTNGAIFDTSTYHQPLDTKSPKKKSSVLTWILWTIVLLAVGATTGAAWFYFTTQ